jgi:hypothetical protein
MEDKLNTLGQPDHNGLTHFTRLHTSKQNALLDFRADKGHFLHDADTGVTQRRTSEKLWYACSVSCCTVAMSLCKCISSQCLHCIYLYNPSGESHCGAERTQIA